MGDSGLLHKPPVFIGFRVKVIEAAPHWLISQGGLAAEVKEICSISDCISKPPDDWMNRWDFNRGCCYSSEQLALATIPAGEKNRYELFAYRLHPVRFSKCGAESIDLDRQLDAGLPELPAGSDLPGYAKIGCDVANGPLHDASEGPVAVFGFGCSPLSCNGCAAEIAVNRYCLIDDLSRAAATGIRFASEEPEPGPFYLYEVFRKRSEHWSL